MKKSLKRIVVMLLTTVMILGSLPVSVFAALGDIPADGKPVGKVWVKIEDTVPTPEGKNYPDPRGVMLEPTEVDIYATDSAMDAVARVCAQKGMPTKINEGYISSIDGLSEFGRGSMSGWMVTLNDWFTNEGLGGFTVANGKLTDGDLLSVMYTLSYGTDLGSDWGSNDKSVKAIETDQGTLEPVFDKAVKDYTLYLPKGTTAVKVTPTATNKNYLVRTSVNGTEYKRMTAIPVSEGSVIKVECGNPSWPSMNENSGNSHIYNLKVAYKNNAPILSDGVVSPTEVKVGADASYHVDLNTIFADPDGDALTYSVSIDGAEAVFANANYSVKPDKNMTLVFKANDGTVDSSLNYEVKILKTNNTAPVYRSGVTGYEELSKEIYVSSGATSYSYLDPSKYFMDPEGDVLNYSVSVNGGAWEAINGNSFRITDQLGTFIYRFKANDGEFESPIHTVAYTFKEATQIKIGCIPNDRLTGGDGYNNFSYLYDPTLSNVLQMTYKITPADRLQAVTWSLESGQEYADIDASGKLTFKDNLTKNAYVKVVAQTEDGKKSDKIVMFYTAGPQLKETEKTLTLRTDGKEEVATKVSLTNYDFSNAVKVTSADESIATVTSSGVDLFVTPHKPGTTEIKVAAAWNENYYSTLKINVKGVAVEPADVNASKVIILKKGETTTMPLKAYAEDANAAFTWSSSDEKVATVDENGVVTAIAAGPVVITAKVKSDGVVGAIVDQVAPQQGAILLQVRGEGIPYMDDFQMSNYRMFGWSTNNEGFVPTMTDYDLTYTPNKFWPNYNWSATSVFDSEKYNGIVKYTDYSGKVSETKIVSGKATTITNILAPGTVQVEYRLEDKTNPENKTIYHFNVKTPGTNDNQITRMNLFPNIDGVMPDAHPTHEGKAEGTLFQFNNGVLGNASFTANTTAYKAFVFDGTNQITLKPTFKNVYEKVRLVVDDQVVGDLKNNVLSDGITLNASGTTVIKLQVVSSEKYLTKTAAGEDPFATPDKVYTITVEKVTPAAADMRISSATLEQGSFYAPGFNSRAKNNRAMIDFGVDKAVLNFTVPNGYKVYKDKVAVDNEVTGTVGEKETTYKVETIFNGKTNASQDIILKDEASGSENKYTFNYQHKGDPAYIPTGVTEYLCLGSQYTNAESYGLFPEKTLEGIKNTGGNMGGSILSLGNFGGHIVYRFDTPIVNDPKNPSGVDFIVAGNSFGGAGASEPGSVEVSQDGKTWYTLAGSVHYDDEADWQFQMTYTNENGMSAWKASDGTSGSNYQYPLASKYPLYQWNQDNRQQINVSGLRLVNNSKDPYGSAAAAYPDFGYVDTHKNGKYGEATNPYAGEKNVKDGMFDLEWAVDAAGNPVQLDQVNYVRVSTASSIYAGAIGEKSTEVQYIAKTMNPAVEAVGKTAAPTKVTVDTIDLQITEGQKSYEAAVHKSFDVRVEAPAEANVYINGTRATEKHFDAVPVHGKIRIIVQEGEKEPAIYVVTLKDFATEGAKQVIGLIENLPDSSVLDISDKEAVNVAKAAYDSLKPEQVALVPENIQTKLKDCINRISEIETAIANVALKIKAMPEVKDLNLGYEVYVNDTKALYDALTEPQKAQISAEDTSKLTDAVKKIVELRKAEDDLNAALKVDEQIKFLPDEQALVLGNKEAINAARAAYDALTADQKQLVKELNKLEKAEQRIAELEKIAADQAAAQMVIDQIKALGTIAQLDQKQNVEAARAAYDALTADQKAYVDENTLKVLTDAEAKIIELEKIAADQAAAKVVQDQIDALPSKDNMVLSDKAVIESARAAYELLTADQKAYVSNLQKLEESESKLVELEKAAADQEVAQVVIDMIQKLGQLTDLEQKKDVVAARAAYDKLTAEQKAYVDESVLKVLTDAEAKILELEKIAADQKAAQAVVDQINGLGSITKLEQQKAVEAARTAYNALTADQKVYVDESVLKILTDAEAKIAELKAASQKPANQSTQVQSQNTNGQSGSGIANVATGLTDGSQFMNIVAVLVVLALLSMTAVVIHRKKH